MRKHTITLRLNQNVFAIITKQARGKRNQFVEALLTQALGLSESAEVEKRIESIERRLEKLESLVTQ